MTKPKKELNLPTSTLKLKDPKSCLGCKHDKDAEVQTRAGWPVTMCYLGYTRFDQGSEHKRPNSCIEEIGE